MRGGRGGRVVRGGRGGRIVGHAGRGPIGCIGRGRGWGDVINREHNDVGSHVSNNDAKTNAAVATDLMEEDELHYFGLSLVGFGPSRQNVCARTNMARFKAHFGPGPATIQAILIDLKREHHGPIKRS